MLFLSNKYGILSHSCINMFVYILHYFQSSYRKIEPLEKIISFRGKTNNCQILAIYWKRRRSVEHFSSNKCLLPFQLLWHSDFWLFFVNLYQEVGYPRKQKENLREEMVLFWRISKNCTCPGKSDQIGKKLIFNWD